MAEIEDELSLRSTGTLVIWLSCLGIGVAGLAYSHEPSPPRISIQRIEAVGPKATSIDIVQMSSPSEAKSMPQSPPPPTSPPAESTPAVPPLPAVAAVKPAIPFAIPEKLQRALAPATKPSMQSMPASAGQTSHQATAANAQSPASPQLAGEQSAVQQLVYGQGEGKQPPPMYPREAQLGRQEGTIIVRFSINASGEVTDAAAVTRCPWPLLNQAAVRAVRETWHFAGGTQRTFEVAIRFQLQHR